MSGQTDVCSVLSRSSKLPTQRPSVSSATSSRPNFLWLHRIKGLPPPDLDLWTTYPIERLRQMVDDGSKQWNEYIDSTDNFNRVLKYKNFVGDYYENNVEHIMMHLVNHGSYHRGQVAVLLRDNGYEPINTDFITWDRVVTGQWKE